MKSRSAAIKQWMKEIREVATESRTGGDIKAINCFLSASAKNLAYLRFEAQVAKKTAPKKTKKAA